jgi:hypothetical protein
MSTGPQERMDRAHAIVAGFDDRTGAGVANPGAWPLERSTVAARLHELIDHPDLVRQGRLNLCGAAALFAIWLRRDPEAVATFASRLFDEGRSAIGDLPVVASPALRSVRPGADPRSEVCPAADWMMMAALRDSTNRMLRYAHLGGPAEAAAAITMPGAMRRWLSATGLFVDVSDQTTLVRRPARAHARSLRPGPDREVLLLVAQEMLRSPVSRLGRARDRVVGLVPNHWVILRSPVDTDDAGSVTFRFWSWGAQYQATLSPAGFARGYHGCLDASVRPGP